MSEQKAKAEAFVNQMQTLHTHLFDYRTRTILMARAALGGKENEEILRRYFINLRCHALEAIEASRHLRTLDLPVDMRLAAETLRSEAVLICGLTRTQVTSDGTLPFQPKQVRMEYNCSVLKHYERLLDSATCLRDVSQRCAV